MRHFATFAAELVCNANPNLTLTLILCKGASLRSITFCEGANTNFIRRRSERANPRSESANSRSIIFYELTLDLRVLALGLRVVTLDLFNFCKLTIVLRKLTLDFI